MRVLHTAVWKRKHALEKEGKGRLGTLVPAPRGMLISGLNPRAAFTLFAFAEASASVPRKGCAGEAHAARRHASPQLTLEQHGQPSYLNSALVRLVKVIDFEIAERLYIL